MMQIQCEIHDYMTSESEFITDQRLCLGPVSQPQPLTFSLGSFAACFTLQSYALFGI